LDTSEIVEDDNEDQETPDDEGTEVESDHEVLVSQGRTERARREKPARSTSDRRGCNVTAVERRENGRLDGTTERESRAPRPAREVTARAASPVPSSLYTRARAPRTARVASADAPRASRPIARNVAHATSGATRDEFFETKRDGGFRRPARSVPPVKWIKPDKYVPPAPLESYLSHFETIATHNQ